MTALRVAFIRADFDPYGGAERFTNLLMQSLAARGIEIHLFARTWQEQKGANYTIHKVPAISSPSFLRQASFVLNVKNALQKEHFDLIQSNERTLSQHIYRAGDGVHGRWLELRRQRAGLLKNISIKLNPFHIFTLWLEKKMFEHNDLRAIIVNSEMVRKEITGRFNVDNAKIHTIYNGVDLQRFRPDSERKKQMRREAGVDAKTSVALFVGSGYERKGVIPLLKALANSNRNIHLWIVGKDNLKKYKKIATQEGVANRVTFWGSQEDVQPFYAAADFFVLPTLYDPFPSVALEALASGLPIIITRQCGAAEVVTSEVNGLILDRPEDPILAEYLNILAAKSPAMAIEAHNCAQQYPIEKTVTTILELYNSLLN